jgi:hypothetical protein
LLAPGAPAQKGDEVDDGLLQVSLIQQVLKGGISVALGQLVVASRMTTGKCT